MDIAAIVVCMKPAGVLGLILIILGGIAVAYEGSFSAQFDSPTAGYVSTASAWPSATSNRFALPPALTVSGLLGGIVLVIAGYKREAI
jgi:MFS superfamily sulfate permease-like transporter